MITLLMVLLFIVALFLILLVMVQRGKGGGLAGAFGGLGGQSAFGTKAGDLFTRVTVVVATVWIILCMVCVRLLSGGASDILTGAGTPPASHGSATPGAPAKGTSTKSTGGTAAPADAAKPAPSGSTATPAAPASTSPAGAKPATAK